MLPMLYNMLIKNVFNEVQLKTSSCSSDLADAVTSFTCSELSNGYHADNHKEYVPFSEYCHSAHTETKF